MLAHVVSDVCPYAKKHTLAFVVACTVFVRLTEVSSNNWAIYRGDNFCQGN
jgi:hypothetical protein